MTQEYFVYIITNHTNSVFYIGITNNLSRRILEHKSGLSPDSFSKRYKLYKLVWFQQFLTSIEAIENEKKIKGWLRIRKINLISEFNPLFKDLSCT